MTQDQIRPHAPYLPQLDQCALNGKIGRLPTGVGVKQIIVFRRAGGVK